MDFFKRFLNSRPTSGTATLEVFSIRFPNNRTAQAVRVPRSVNPQSIIQALHLPNPAPTIFISGGAASMDLNSMAGTRSTIEDGLARFLNERQVNLIDGGTATGVMMLVGIARQRRSYTFPLIGVAPEKTISYPGFNPDKNADLDAFHTHFVLVDGDEFGAESDLILDLAYALTGKGVKKRLVMIVNGGEIVKKEAHLCSTHEPRFPLLVLEGTGRFADELADSRKNGSSDPMIQDILNQGIVHFISIKAGADNLYRWLQNFFGY